jgi:hypothetical protein
VEKVTASEAHHCRNTDVGGINYLRETKEKDI